MKPACSVKGGGAGIALVFTVVADLFPPAERPRWQGIFGSVYAIASVIGPAFGGWVADNGPLVWPVVNISVAAGVALEIAIVRGQWLVLVFCLGALVVALLMKDTAAAGNAPAISSKRDPNYARVEGLGGR